MKTEGPSPYSKEFTSDLIVTQFNVAHILKIYFFKAPF
jgi:hypothetical protein